MTVLPLERLYSVAEVAAHIHRDPSTTRRKIAAGEFPNAYDDGDGRSHYLVPESDLIAYLDARRVNPTKEN